MPGAERTAVGWRVQQPNPQPNRGCKPLYQASSIAERSAGRSFALRRPAYRIRSGVPHSQAPNSEAPDILPAQKRHVLLDRLPTDGAEGLDPAETVHQTPLCGTVNALRRIAAALDKLNEEGQEKVATYAEDLVEMPKYQAQEPPTEPPQDTPAPQEGTDTTPPADGPEGRITSITTFCPICGMMLRGDPSTGKAYCRSCNRTFPLPASRSRNK